MPDVPSWWEFFLLAAGVFRLYRLIAEDTILDGPRNKLLRLSAGWRDDENYVPPPEYRAKWAAFLTCPWCLGWWLALGAYLLWVWFPTEVLTASVPFALSAIVALTAKNLDKDEE